MGNQVEFPFQKGSTGYFLKSSDYESIRGRLIQLLLTYPGERVNLPFFGVGMHRFLNEPLDLTTVSQIKSAIAEQMAQYEPMLKLLSTSVWADYSVQPPICHVLMTIRSLKSQDDLSFDFSVKYRNPLFF